MGTVHLPTFFRRWRCRYVWRWEEETPKLVSTIWHRTQEQAELHAIFLLETVSWTADFYDFQHEAGPRE